MVISLVDPNRSDAWVRAVRRREVASYEIFGAVDRHCRLHHGVLLRMPLQGPSELGPVMAGEAAGQKKPRFGSSLRVIDVQQVVQDLSALNQAIVGVRQSQSVHLTRLKGDHAPTRRLELDLDCPFVRIDVHDSAARPTWNDLSLVDHVRKQGDGVGTPRFNSLRSLMTGGHLGHRQQSHDLFRRHVARPRSTGT
jgi:hypothetical protein